MNNPDPADHGIWMETEPIRGSGHDHDFHDVARGIRWAYLLSAFIATGYLAAIGVFLWLLYLLVNWVVNH